MNRRPSRELALKLLYAAEFSGLERFDDADQDVKNYALKILDWTKELNKDLEKDLKIIIKNWSMDRLSKIDKILIYMGCAEIKKGEEPAAVVINEMVELAKQYGEKESASFVNGIIDAWLKMR